MFKKVILALILVNVSAIGYAVGSPESEGIEARACSGDLVESSQSSLHAQNDEIQRIRVGGTCLICRGSSCIIVECTGLS